MSASPPGSWTRPSPRSLAARFVAWPLALLVAAALAWWVPLVRLKRLDAVAAADTFDAAAFAARFWSEDLPPALAKAHDLTATLAALRSDPIEACRTLGRTPGLSRTCLYLVRGSGTIREVGPTGCRVSLADEAGEVELATGPVFGSSIRDVTGTVDPASRTDSRDLAAVASEINRLVQDRVIGPMKAALEPGHAVEFVACGQLQGRLPDGRPWRLIPLHAEVLAEAAVPASEAP